MKVRYIPCEKDGLPLIKINGREQCLGDLYTQCLHMRKVVDLVKERNTYYLIFDDGHQVPMLCPCCGEPLGINNPNSLKKDMVGRKVKDFDYELIGSEENPMIEDLQLEFSRKFLEFEPPVMQYSILSAHKIIHPVSCINHRPSISEKNRKKK